MPGMEGSWCAEPPADGTVPVADGIAPWFIPGIDDESWDEEPQATRVSARAADRPAAARARRRTAGRAGRARREGRGSRASCAGREERAATDMAVRSFRVG